MSHVDFKKWLCRILCHLFSPMSHVEFKKELCPMSLYFLPSCRMSLGLMSHVEFKNSPCSPVNFRGQGPFITCNSMLAGCHQFGKDLIEKANTSL